MLNGSCHCGAVKFESAGQVVRFVFCHCDDCRKINGSAFSSAVVVESGGFRVTQGEGDVSGYPSSPGKIRTFCRKCGSPLYSKMDYQPEIVILRAGSLDGDHGLKPQMH